MNLFSLLVRVTTLSVVSALCVVATPRAFGADEKPAAEKKAEKKPDAKTGAKKSGERRGPLPFFYAKVVTPEQREKIYQIQEKYDAELAPLSKQVKEITARRAQEIEAVLTPEQREKIAALQAEAKAKTPAGKKPASGDSAKTDKAGEGK